MPPHRRNTIAHRSRRRRPVPFLASSLIALAITISASSTVAVAGAAAGESTGAAPAVLDRPSPGMATTAVGGEEEPGRTVVAPGGIVDDGDDEDERDEEERIVRLHLVRHGETEANLQNLVLGQTDSPLTPSGIRQAHAASAAFGLRPYWRRYASDLPRARRTANIILGREKNPDDEAGSHGDGIYRDLILDVRLREQGKGARELKNKSLTYEEAVELRRRESPGKALPLLETSEEVWERFQRWIDDLLRDALAEEGAATVSAEAGVHEEAIEAEGGIAEAVGVVTAANGDGVSTKRRRTASGVAVAEAAPQKRKRRVIYDVLAVSHSGTLRTAITQLVPNELPPGVNTELVGRDGAKAGSLVVPNVSVTTIDIVPTRRTEGTEVEEVTEVGAGGTDSAQETGRGWTAKLVKLTRTDYLDGVK